MITTMTLIYDYIINKLMYLGFFSFIFNSIFIILIKKNLFGSKFKQLVADISKSKKNAILIQIKYLVFVYILILMLKLNINTIYLENVTVDLKVNGMSVQVNGDIFSVLKETFGESFIFLGSARLAYLILSQNSSLNAFSKLGIILGSGAGGLTSYKVVDRSARYLSDSKPNILLNGTLKLDTVNVSTHHSYQIPDHPVLSYIFGMNKGIDLENVHRTFKVTRIDGITKIQGDDSMSIINALNNSNPN